MSASILSRMNWLGEPMSSTIDQPLFFVFVLEPLKGLRSIASDNRPSDVDVREDGNQDRSSSMSVPHISSTFKGMMGPS
ncbi:hypothetical protein [Thioalkalivibrio sp. HK1]|uniref:hypothetical protein n=1 Tax=Thioalkalivibrio sp. HK1 TaxID=1469245 RepID=UPI0012DE6EF6|nr:hypothetical protein [Thioalkalivibrio sp. HK1]